MMEIEKAKWALENLFDRIERDSVSGNWKLNGSITIGEREALIAILSFLDPNISSKELIPNVKAVSSVIEYPLNIHSTTLSSPENPSVTLCLDFGTAMSKAFAIDGDDEKLLDIAVGQKAGYSESVYSIPSSVFISGTGQIFLGHEAISQSLQDQTPGRQRFDSPKQELSQGTTTDLSTVRVSEAINPTNTPFTKEELITLYLGYLTDMACSDLQEGHGQSRYVLRRFARPCWDSQRVEWAEKLLIRMLSRAQIIADTFTGKWTGGLDVEAVRIVFDKLNAITPPAFLVDGGVEEPVAAAASIVLNGERDQPGFLIVDIGAGTTDFGLFVATQNKNSGKSKIFRLPGSIHGIRQAGDTIDNFLRASILKKHNVDIQSPYGSRIGAELNIHIRRYKETLFRDGVLNYLLVDDTPGIVNLPEFLESPEVARFSKGLKDAIQKTFDNVHESWIRKMFETQGVLVVLTGGGARLPMVQELAKGWIDTRGIKIICHAAPIVPTWIADDYAEFTTEFPQLAVAMGGASSELPEMGPDKIEFGGLANPTYQAGNIQLKGV